MKMNRFTTEGTESTEAVEVITEWSSGRVAKAGTSPK